MKKILIILVIALLGYIHETYGLDNLETYGVDNLVLHGVVKKIDKQQGIIVIDTKIRTCSGERTFRFDPKDIPPDVEVLNKDIRFILDSPKCEIDRIHKIKILLKPRGVS